MKKKITAPRSKANERSGSKAEHYLYTVVRAVLKDMARSKEPPPIESRLIG